MGISALVFAITWLVSFNTAYAQFPAPHLFQVAKAAGQDGNGGDICEDRIKTIAQDINSWISLGGAQSLKLPLSVSVEKYNQGMQLEIKNALVACQSEPIKIGESEKACTNFIDKSHVHRIVCNAKRMMETAEADQYVLIHHEFAGLNDFEKNDGERSNYEISNQITGYLEDQVVKKLKVRPLAPQPPDCPRHGCYNNATEWIVQCGPQPSLIDPINLSDVVRIEAIVQTRKSGVTDEQMAGRPDRMVTYRTDLYVNTFNGTLNWLLGLNLKFVENTEQEKIYAYVTQTSQVTTKNIVNVVTSPTSPDISFSIGISLVGGQPRDGGFFAMSKTASSNPVMSRKLSSCQMIKGTSAYPLPL
jgi:hypothetical protein